MLVGAFNNKEETLVCAFSEHCVYRCIIDVKLQKPAADTI